MTEQKHSATGMNGTLRQTAHSHSWQGKHESPAKPFLDHTEHDCPERPLTSIGITQTLPKLHLASSQIGCAPFYLYTQKLLSI